MAKEDPHTCATILPCVAARPLDASVLVRRPLEGRPCLENVDVQTFERPCFDGHGDERGAWIPVLAGPPHPREEGETKDPPVHFRGEKDTP